MECAHCRSENLDNARFCNQCGYPLEKAARDDFPFQSFDDNLAKIQRYLPQGLTKKILSQRDRIEGERRHVTVMFCDMEGFTPLVEHLGAESAYSVMDQVYEILIRQVNDYEGTVNEMTGDGIMALFGAPIALEEAPQRALWAARAIHREMAVFNKAKMDSNPIRMRIGVHSGPVVVGTLGNDLRVEFKAVGDTVNLASRMERLAEPGTTCVTREVFKLTRGLFEFENLGRKVVKGWGENIPVYKVLPGHQDIHRPQLGSERLIFSEMVGRDSKLDMLERHVVKLIGGEGAIVNIIGEAGIGKSRLMAELRQRALMRQVNVLEGWAISMGRNLPFHPVVDILKQWAGIGDEDGQRVALAKLEAGLQPLFPGRIGEVLPFLATLMGMSLHAPYRDRLKGIEGEALEKLIRKSLREFLIRLSEWRPLMVIVDDLHWADSSTIELLEFLFRLVKQARILFINLFRPGYEETGQRVLKTLQEHLAVYRVDIQLEPLNDGMSEAMITSMLDLKGFNHAVVKQIVERAGGNPYFIEEVARSFIDEEAVILRDGQFRVTDKFGRMTIPNTINDVLMARIDRLEEDARELLKIAAVIGRNFFYRVLVEVTGSSHRVDERLSYLKETQLVLERERLDELEYQFKHALTQEAAYAAILPQKRKALHLKVAQAIEKVFAEKLYAFYGMLAYHYSRAEDLEKAEGALIKAGEEALKSSASSEALHYYLEALNLYRQKSGRSVDATKVALLEKNIALAFHNRGQYEEAIQYFDRSLDVFLGKTPRNMVTSCLRFTSSFIHLLVALYLPILKFKKVPTADEREAIDLYYKKCQALIVIYPRRWFIESFYFYRYFTKFNFARIPNGAGVLVSASAMFTFTGLSFRLGRRILSVVQSRLDKEDARQMITYDLIQTTLHYFSGKWEAVDRPNDKLAEACLDMGDFWAASMHFYWHGFPLLFQGKLEGVRHCVGRLDTISEIYDNDFSLSFKQLLNAALLMETRRFPEALEEIAAGIEVGKKNRSGLSLVHFYGCQAQIDLLLGNSPAAEEALEKADAIQREQETVPWMLSVFCRSQAELAIYRLQKAIEANGDGEMLKQRLRTRTACRALIRQTCKVAQHRTEAYRLMGTYYWLTRRPRPALKWWRKSIRVGEKLGARAQLSRTYCEIGRCLSEKNAPVTMLDGSRSQDFFGKADTLFRELGLEWDLQLLHSLRSAPLDTARPLKPATG